MEEITSELKDLQKKIKGLLRLFTEFKGLKKDPLNNVYKLETTLSQIKKSIRSDYPISKVKDKVLNWIKPEEELIQRLKQEVRFKFGKELEEFLRQKGFRLHGQYPNLYAGLYLIKAEFERGVVSLFWGPEFIKKVKPEPAQIVEAISRFENELTCKDWKAEDFKSRLFEAYKRVLRINEKKVEDKVPIIEVLRELVFLMQDKKFKASPTKANFREYSRAAFGYDLYRLKLSKEKDKLSLFIATYDATRSKEQTIFVPDSCLTGGTRYAYLSISK
ncbi:MAG: hypothetical protein QME40_02335 [bacterium]|nr:hypothetical protein [bacterium]